LSTVFSTLEILSGVVNSPYKFCLGIRNALNIGFKLLKLLFSIGLGFVNQTKVNDSSLHTLLMMRCSFCEACKISISGTNTDDTYLTFDIFNEFQRHLALFDSSAEKGAIAEFEWRLIGIDIQKYTQTKFISMNELFENLFQKANGLIEGSV
jgi:hypothetical protein